MTTDERLNSLIEMTEHGFATVVVLLAAVQEGFEAMNKRFDSSDQKLVELDGKLDNIQSSLRELLNALENAK